MAKAALFVLCGTGEVEFGKKRVNIGVLAGSNAITCGYAPATLFFTYAYAAGSFSFTGLAISYSLLLPAFYGIIFLHEKTTWCFYAGLVLLCVAIYLITVKKEDKTEDKEKKLSLKWLIFVIIGFIANGCCSIFQTTEQINLDGRYKSEMMIIGLTISAIIFLAVSFFTERKELKEGFKQSVILGGASGALNGLSNLCILYSVNYLASSIVFPLIGGGSLALSFITARVFFKEKYAALQYVGFLVSIVSVVLLNL